MKNWLGVSVVVVALATPQGAGATEEMPYFDVDGYCHEIAAMGGNMSQVLLKACFESEQTSYDKTKIGWSELPNEIRKHCSELAAFGGKGSYALLEACVDSEQAAGADNKSLKFKR